MDTDETDYENSVNRRGFLSVCVWLFPSGMAISLGIPGVRYLLGPIWESAGKTWVDLGEIENLGTGSSPIEIRFRYVSKDGFKKESRAGLALLLPRNKQNRRLRVLSPICTHKGCNVAWATNENCFICPCHGGQYALDGSVIAGPPPAPLLTIPSEIRAGRLWIEVGGAL